MLEKLQKIKQRYDELSAKIADPSFISNMPEWQKAMKEHSNLEELVEEINVLETLNKEIEDEKELLEIETDAEMRALISDELFLNKENYDKSEEKIKLLLLPKDENDERNVIMEIRGGVGGEEAHLFAAALFRMYKMYAETKRWKIELIDINETELGGIKEVSFMVKGKNAFKYLKFESGVHRVQRVPETEAQGRVHTSTVTVAVLPEIEDIEVEVKEKDLRVDTYCSSSAGGQHVNKTESAIRLTYLPLNLVVTCQDERSLIKNKEKAMHVLKSRLYDYYRAEADKEYSDNRKNQVGSGDRSERIRTYNYPQGRVSDHRINLTLYSLEDFLNGDLTAMIDALLVNQQRELLEKHTN